MSCIMKADVWKNYYAFRIQDPKKYIEIKNPEWARVVAESVSKGAFVTTGMKKDGDWDVQSVKILRAEKTIAEARKLAEKIIEKLKACE